MRFSRLSLLFILAGLAFIVLYLVLSGNEGEEEITAGTTAVTGSGLADSQVNTTPGRTATPAAAATPQPIFPTATRPTAGAGSANGPESLIPSTAPMTMTFPAGYLGCPNPDCLSRFGVSGTKEDVVAAYAAGLPFGNYLNWWAEPDPPEPDAVEFWQVLGLNRDGPVFPWSEIDSVIEKHPGSIWVVGNEPDVIWQDNVPADRYAHIYHDVYAYIKERDPLARIAAGSVSQPTPLRLAYLDVVLETYQMAYGWPMPVDIWTVHGFILREEAGSWGVDIPPGMAETTGQMYEIADHADLAIFRQNIENFRAWMAQNGYANRPLAVTEFGVLHPADYGFPDMIVAEYMVAVFDFLMTAANDTGYPADDYRLVQWWFWFSVYNGGDFPTGNLYDPARGGLTFLGEVYAKYVQGGEQ